MKNKYKIALGIIVIMLFITCFIFAGYKIHNKNKKNNTDVIVDQDLSINYFGGKKIEFNDKVKEIEFSVINDGDSENFFDIEITTIKTEKQKITYSLYENEKIIIDNNELMEGTNLISSFLDLKALETKTYKIQFKNNKKANVSLELNVKKASKEDSGFSQLILNNNQVNKESKTKIGEQIAVNDEGLILDVDDNGNTFYFRGNVKNNYVEFAGKLWRIVRINGNGTIKLILNSGIGNSVIYNAELTNNRLDKLKKYSETKVMNLLNEWYDNNLKEYDKYIVQSKYCINTNFEGENLANYFRINISNIPTFNCLGTKNNSKIGLLTVDEIIYAGATINEPNQYYYLYNTDIQSSWWTLSPAKDSVEGLYYYEISADGKINSTSTGESSRIIRPVINLKKNVEMVGNGTEDNPYKLK